MKTAIVAALMAVLAGQSTPRTDVRLPPETAGWDNVVAGLLSVFDRADVLAANPFYLGQAMLPRSTTIGDLDDACVYFGRTPDLAAGFDR